MALGMIEVSGCYESVGVREARARVRVCYVCVCVYVCVTEVWV